MVETTFLKRQTAYRVWIKDLHNKEVMIDENGLKYLKIGDHNVMRVNIFGVVIDKSNAENYANIVVDDSSANMRMRVWGDDISFFEDLKVGDRVFVIGRWSEFNEERYVRPEIVTSVDMDWSLLRRLQLIKEYGVPNHEEKVIVKEELTEDVEEVEPSLVAREAVLNIIEKHDEADINLIMKDSKLAKEKLQSAIMDLLKEGEIFSPKMGYYRLV
ncbi:MAG: OB-fold nucleic acid binding domain-containing protein [Nanoarchaeota archaeon]|nr:OB-fold nucleic acid binding domain-containing protein [Nanoarchaeota archaeon]